MSARAFLLMASWLVVVPVLVGAAVQGNDARLQELASRVKFEPLTRADGISLGTVVQIFQDHRGFLWFGTTNGLNRYDGYQTTLYTDVPMDRSGPILYPGLLYESRDGSLWVGTQVLSLYRPGMGAVTRFVPPRRAPANSWPQKISAIHEDSGGFFWLGISDFRLTQEISEPILYRFDPKTGTSSAFSIPFAITHGQPGSIRAIEHDKSGALWLGTAYGLIRFDPTAGTFTAYPHTHPRRSYSTALEYTFNELIWDRDGKLWVHMPAGLERFDPETGSFDRFQEAYFWFMFSDAGGVLWLHGGDPAAKLFDPRSGALVPISSDDNEKEPDVIAAALADRAGNVWAYFSRKGLQRYTAAFARFGTVASARGNPASLPVGRVARFSEDRGGKVWISVSGFGLVQFDPATRTFAHFPYKPGNPGGLPGPWIESMYEDRLGTFWIGTAGEFGRLDRKSGIYTRSGALPNNWVTSMFEDRAGRFWVGNTLGPLHLFNRQTGALMPAEVYGGYVSHEDRSGILWFGYPPGLNRLDAAGKVRSVSLLDRPDGSGPENVMVQTLYEDGGGIF